MLYRTWWTYKQKWIFFPWKPECCRCRRRYGCSSLPTSPAVCILTLPAETSADPASPLWASPRRALRLLARGGPLQLPAHKQPLLCKSPAMTHLAPRGRKRAVKSLILNRRRLDRVTPVLLYAWDGPGCLLHKRASGHRGNQWQTLECCRNVSPGTSRVLSSGHNPTEEKKSRGQRGHLWREKACSRNASDIRGKKKKNTYIGGEGKSFRTALQDVNGFSVGYPKRTQHSRPSTFGSLRLWFMCSYKQNSHRKALL